MSNKVLRILDEFLKEKSLTTETFNESTDVIPKSMKPTTLLTIKKSDEQPALLFACDRASYFTDLLENSVTTISLRKQLEKRFNDAGIPQFK